MNDYNADSKNGKKLYVCEECGLHYESEEIKEKCKAWCAEYKSCNLDITKHSVESKKSNKFDN